MLGPVILSVSKPHLTLLFRNQQFYYAKMQQKTSWTIWTFQTQAAKFVSVLKPLLYNNNC